MNRLKLAFINLSLIFEEVHPIWKWVFFCICLFIFIVEGCK